jgi:hypothetical protein
LISGPSRPLRVAVSANNSNNNTRNNNDDDNNVLCWPCRMKWERRRRIGNYDGENEVEEKERGRR